MERLMQSDRDSTPGPAALRVTAASNEAGLRLDVWLARRAPSLSRARIQALREEIAVIRGVSLLDATEPPAA